MAYSHLQFLRDISGNGATVTRMIHNQTMLSQQLAYSPHAQERVSHPVKLFFNFAKRQ